MPLRIANGAGFLGDNLDAPRLLVERAEVDYLTLEYLAELTLSILARQKEKDSNAGFANDFLEVLASLAPPLAAQPQLKIITNAGGMNPLACVQAAAGLRVAAGFSDEKLGIVTGDDLLPQLRSLQGQGCRFVNLDTGQPLELLGPNVVSANAYLGARPIAEALAAGARTVITGRVADASLTVGPVVHEFRWSWSDWNRLAQATVAGHLIECGAQATGGYSTNWQEYNLAEVGYPIAEIEPNGECVITKPSGTGGAVNRRIISEQLIYEIGDPQHYLTPDVDTNFATVELDEIGPDRVAVRGASGLAAPENYKVSLAYRAGFAASGQLTVFGSDCIEKGRACGDLILRRVAGAGFPLERTNVELLGTGIGVPNTVSAPPPSPREVVLRVTVQDSRREAVERFTKEFAPLITSGPAGLAGYAVGRPQVRPVYAYWPTVVPQRLVASKVEVRTAQEWLEEVTS